MKKDDLQSQIIIYQTGKHQQNSVVSILEITAKDGF